MQGIGPTSAAPERPAPKPEPPKVRRSAQGVVAVFIQAVFHEDSYPMALIQAEVLLNMMTANGYDIVDAAWDEDVEDSGIGES